MRGYRGFVIIGNAHTVGGNWEPTYGDANRLLINTTARFANGHYDTPPICVLAGNRCFNKW